MNQVTGGCTPRVSFIKNRHGELVSGKKEYIYYKPEYFENILNTVVQLSHEDGSEKSGDNINEYMELPITDETNNITHNMTNNKALRED